jgi:hypothetical protein
VESEPFKNGETTTGFLQKHFHQWQPRPERIKAALLGWMVAELEDVTEPGQAVTVAESKTISDPWARLGHWRMGEE